MDFRLKVFTVVARHLSFTKAANELSISQPAITKHIQELEKICKVQLFERAGGKMTLTHKGSLLLEQAETILKNYRTFASEVEMLQGEYCGELKIVSNSVISQYILPALAAGFVKRFPDIRISMATDNTIASIEAIGTKKGDLGIVEDPQMDNGLEYIPFADEKYLLVTNNGTAAPKEITIEELYTIPFVLPASNSEMYDVTVKLLSASGVEMRNLTTAAVMDRIEAMIRFVEKQPGVCTLLPESAVCEKLENNILKCIRVNNLQFGTRLFFAVPNVKKNKNVAKFITFATLNLK